MCLMQMSTKPQIVSGEEFDIFLLQSSTGCRVLKLKDRLHVLKMHLNATVGVLNESGG